MKIQYIEKKFRGPTMDIIDMANDIIDDFTRQGFGLTQNRKVNCHNV